MRSTLIAVTFAALGLGFASAEEERAPSSTSGLSGLLDTLRENVSELEVPANMSELPQQFAELRKNYMAQTQALESLQKEVKAMRQELDALQAEVAALKGETPAAQTEPR